MKVAKDTLRVMRTTERMEVLRDFFRNVTNTPIDDQIAAVLAEMTKVGVNSDQYSRLIEQLEQLNEIKTKERQPPVSRDTVALILGNLMGILLIVAYEQKHVVSSKGFNQILRPK